MKLQAASKKEISRIAVGTLVCDVIMIAGLFLLSQFGIGKFDTSPHSAWRGMRLCGGNSEFHHSLPDGAERRGDRQQEENAAEIPDELQCPPASSGRSGSSPHT